MLGIFKCYEEEGGRGRRSWVGRGGEDPRIEG